MSPTIRTEPLTYAVTPRLNLRRLIIRSLASIALFIFCAWLLTKAYRWHYYAEPDRVQAILEAATPNGRVQLGGYDDGPFEWQLVEALISVDGSPGKTILLSGPRDRHLRTGRHMHVSRLGAYHFTLVTSKGYSSGIDFGKDGPFPDLLPFKPNNVNDLVRHYDDFATFVESLPPTGVLPARDGKQYPYDITAHPNAPGKLLIRVHESP